MKQGCLVSFADKKVVQFHCRLVPVFQAKALYPLEFAQVGAHKGGLQGNRRSCYEHVVGANGVAFEAKLVANLYKYTFILLS